MTTATSKLPREGRPLRMDPDLARAIEDLLDPYSGKVLERAQAAVLKVRASAVMGPFAEVVDAYRDGIENAVKAKS